MLIVYTMPTVNTIWFQYGWCLSNDVDCAKEVYDDPEIGKQTDVIVMNFGKEFDTAEHNNLIYKLW